jgi:hypothetical protein
MRHHFPLSCQVIQLSKEDCEKRIKNTLRVYGFKDCNYKAGDISKCILTNLIQKSFAIKEGNDFYYIQKDMSVGVRTELTASISRCSSIPANAAHAVLESICPLS